MWIFNHDYNKLTVITMIGETYYQYKFPIFLFLLSLWLNDYHGLIWEMNWQFDLLAVFFAHCYQFPIQCLYPFKRILMILWVMIWMRIIDIMMIYKNDNLIFCHQFCHQLNTFKLMRFSWVFILRTWYIDQNILSGHFIFNHRYYLYWVDDTCNSWWARCMYETKWITMTCNEIINVIW